MLGSAEQLGHSVAIPLGHGGTDAFLKATGLGESGTIATQLLQQVLKWVRGALCLAEQLVDSIVVRHMSKTLL